MFPHGPGIILKPMLKGVTFLRHFCAWGIALVLFLSSRLALADKVELPCDQPPLFRECSLVLDQWTPTFQGEITDQVEAAYQGRFLNPFAQDPLDRFLGTSSSPRFQSPICDLGRDPSEATENHRSESCDLPCDFDCDQDRDGVEDVCTQKRSTCVAERSWTRGAYMSWIRVKTAEVLAELRGPDHSLDLSARCTAPVGSLASSLVKYQSARASVAQYWSSINLDPLEAPPTCAQSVTSLVPFSIPAIASCHLDSARRSLEASFFELAVCEVFTRAELAWLGAGGTLSFEAVIATTARAAFEDCLPSLPGPIVSCLKNRYRQLIRNRIWAAYPSPPELLPTLVSPMPSPSSSASPSSSPSPSASVAPSVSLSPLLDGVTGCPSGAGGCLPCPNPGLWDELVCGTPPPVPYQVGELGALVKAGELVDSTGNSISAALDEISGSKGSLLSSP